MNYKKENDVFGLLSVLNKSQKLALSRRWAKPPYCDYLYVKVYVKLVVAKQYDSAMLLGQISGLKGHQLANVLKELNEKILEHLRALQTPTPFEEYRILLKNYSVLKGLGLNRNK